MDIKQDTNPAKRRSAGLATLVGEQLGEFFRLPRLNKRGVRWLVLSVLGVWLSAGIYNVQPFEQGVVLRFGKWVATTQPGLHYHLPYPIETVLLPKVTQVNQVQLGVQDASSTRNPDVAQTAHEKQMLTGDENILEADCVVFWQIKDAGQFLFNVTDPETAVKITAESALREIISRTPIQDAMSDKRQQIADQTRELLQKLLDDEKAGVRITEVQLERVDPPSEVIDAFNDVQRARADQERARNEAQAYANDILPRARGEADHIRQEAEAYKTQVVDLARGEAASFLSVYASYSRSKPVIAERLYLDSVDELLKRSSKVIIDSSGHGVAQILPYMPLPDTKPANPAQSPAAAIPK